MFYHRQESTQEVFTIDIRIQVAKKIRKLRKKNNWTQQYLAEKTNLPGPWSVSRLETRGTDSLSTLQIICDAFGIEVWELLRDASGASEAGEQPGQGR